ncbi:pancreatic secretory granule membrane major glycoprotein GP2 [Siphateles boraxobius]|uniref:pancreatic secretory granule membrane major glycoprotein GP2 n=1 Tax=Siphateles boraxobius TaxID=180520 RepID=UPI004064C2CB
MLQTQDYLGRLAITLWTLSVLSQFQYPVSQNSRQAVNNNGLLTFTEQLSDNIPLLNSGRDFIAPLWTHLDNRRGGTISYREDTSSAVLAQVTAAVNQYFPNLPIPFNTKSAFVATWDRVPYSSGEGVVTFQLVLLSNVDQSFILFNYGNIAETRQQWLARYGTVDFAHSYTSLLTSSELSSNSNVNVNGRWVFQVYNVCDTLNCTEDEVCRFRDGYGCGCLEGQRPNPETFDAIEFCASSTGTMSLSRCQLFESDFTPEILHLNDPNCTGTVKDGRVLFHFDNKDHICGTTLSRNGTHFIYQNSIHSNLPTAVITRKRWMNITFSCVYPLIQTLSMTKEIQAEQSVISIDLPGQGAYQIHMIPYHDAQFTRPYEGGVRVGVQVNQQIYMAVEVEGVDRSQIATVLDNCWATPVNESEYQIRWNLIIRECPNPEDGTVEVIQNGIDTTSRFSFRIFTFTGASDRIFVHCQVHLCLVQNGRCAQSCIPGRRRRRRRSLDFYHSAAITIGL